MPTFVNKASQSNFGSGPYTSGQVTYTPTAGNTLVLGVYLQNANASVSSVFDDQGHNIFGNPINTWQNLGTVNLGTTRLELWGCLVINQVPAKVNVLLSDAQNVLILDLFEYSGVSSFGLSGSTSNSGYSSLFFQGTAQNNTDILFAFYGLPVNADGASGAGTYNKPGHANFVITPATTRHSIIGWGGQTLALEQTVINNPQLLISQLYLVNNEVATTGILACGVVLQGGLALQTPPGFSDVDETSLTAGTVIHALKMNQIAQNASLGMVRPEFFYGTYLDGDTVNVPVSPIDQYQYSRDELIYIYTPYTTFSAQTGWTSADGILFYCMWDVDPVTGQVTVKEYYHPDGNKPTNETSDGQLLVLTVAQRGMNGLASSGLTMSKPPSLVNTPLSLCGSDLPLTQTLMQTLALNSKFGAVKAEVFYMGEFVDGTKVQPPISYVDGYQYAYDECIFISSWLWTSNPNSFGPPPMATASGGNADGGWSQMNQMKASVDAQGNVTCRVNFYNHQVVDPTQPANGGVAYGRLRVYCFTQRAKGPVFAIPPLVIQGNSSGSVTQSFVAKVTGIIGSVTGSLSVTLAASNKGNCTVSKVVVKKTAAGGDSVLSTTTLWSGGTINAGTQFVTSPVAYTMDASHDYYIIAVLTNGYECYQNLAGLVNSHTQVNYSPKNGDLSGNTTISSMGLTLNSASWYLFQAIHMVITGDTVANEFKELPLTDEIAVFVPGNPLTYPYMTQLAQNVKEGAYAVEFFGPSNHSNGDTIPTPTSPVDGYAYSRSELLYIWQWHDTGTPVIRLFGWGASISAAGLVNAWVFHCKDGGPPANNNGGSSIDVITIGCRTQNQSQKAISTTAVGNPPSDLSSLAFGGSGGFTINGGS